MELDERFLVQQMDETWLTQVVWSQKDKEAGKKNGAKGLLRERISGELSDGPGIVLYTYSKTRSVEFLKKALKNMAGYLIRDAYGAYFAMQKIKSCLFAYSECGAEAFGRIMSVIWTAIMNGADPFYYVKFILEEWAKLEQDGVKDRKQWFAKRMPWSPNYIEWERQQKAHHADEFVPDSEKPREGERVRCKGELPADWKAPSFQEQVA